MQGGSGKRNSWHQCSGSDGSTAVEAAATTGGSFRGGCGSSISSSGSCWCPVDKRGIMPGLMMSNGKQQKLQDATETPQAAAVGGARVAE